MLEIALFGQENDGLQAHWGPGQRPFYILHYILQGEGCFNGRVVHSGEGFLIRENCLHEYYSSDHAPWQYFYVIFRGALAEQLSVQFQADEYGIFPCPFIDRIRNLARHLFSIREPVSHYQALGYFYLLLSFHDTAPDPAKSALQQHVAAAKRYLDLHYMRQVTVEETARSIPLNPRYLSRIFLSEEGITPKEYLNQIRVERACELLNYSNLSISQIAASVGYENVLVFSRFFSKKVGMSPTAYRSNALVLCKSIHT